MKRCCMMVVLAGTILVLGGPTRQGVAGGGKPTKDAAVKVLREVAAALDAKEYEKAAKHFHFPPNVKVDVRKALADLVAKQEISAKGVEILAAKGKWGTLAEIFGKRAENFAKRFMVPVDSCYGLGLEPAEAGFYWDGSAFRIIRLDDVGKLK